MGVETVILEFYNGLMASLPSWGQQIVQIFLLILLVVIYAIVFWKFHRFIAHKNIFELNLNQYNTSDHPIFSKIIAGFFYLLEYIIIMPIIILIWFGLFAIFLILLTEGTGTGNVIVVSVIIIGAIRMISYIRGYGQTLAKDISKLLPLTLLAVAVTREGFFNIQRVITHINQIPTFLSQIGIYLMFILFLEVIMRIFDFISSFFYSEEVREKES